MIGLSFTEVKLIGLICGMWIVELNCVKKVLSEVTHGEDTYDMECISSRGEVVIPARTIKDSQGIIGYVSFSLLLDAIGSPELGCTLVQ
jgi:hypothetical protein